MISKRLGAVSFLCTISIALSALTLAARHMPAHAQSADLVLCDRVAADPTDPDKPADIKGTATIAPSDIAIAIKYCKAAAGKSRRAHAAPRERKHQVGQYSHEAGQPERQYQQLCSRI